MNSQADTAPGFNSRGDSPRISITAALKETVLTGRHFQYWHNFASELTKKKVNLKVHFVLINSKPLSREGVEKAAVLHMIPSAEVYEETQSMTLKCALYFFGNSVLSPSKTNQSKENFSYTTEQRLLKSTSNLRLRILEEATLHFQYSPFCLLGKIIPSHTGGRSNFCCSDVT